MQYYQNDVISVFCINGGAIILFYNPGPLQHPSSDIVDTVFSFLVECNNS